MTLFDDDWPPWQCFQARITCAIVRTSDEYQTVGSLLNDLRVCELFLRMPGDSLRRLEDLKTPGATELRAALETHAAEDNVRYDTTCAATVVRASMNEIVNAAAEGDP